MVRGMNKGLISLMEPRSRRLPFIPASTFLDIDVLRKRDTIHAAALHQEGLEGVEPPNRALPCRLGAPRPGGHGLQLLRPPEDGETGADRGVHTLQQRLGG